MPGVFLLTTTTSLVQTLVAPLLRAPTRPIGAVDPV
jgi:hypothetical protein